ncbi:MAG: hypothetical protein ACR2QF_16965 [Geminicoccaceae bacterium]
MNKIIETTLGVVGLIVIPPVVGSFALVKEDTTISVQTCETVHGRRGSADNVYTVDGEKLEIAPSWIGGPDSDYAWKRLCPDQRAQVTIRGVRVEQLPFWHRMIFDVE